MNLTLNLTAAQFAEDDLFDLASADPFLDLFDEETEELATICPYHGPHEVDEEGVSLFYCERCERRL